MNDYGTAGEPAYSIDNPPPTGAAAATPAAPTFDVAAPPNVQYQSILASYDQQVQAATSALQQAAQARDAAQQRLTAVLADPTQRALLGQQAQTAYDAALTQWRTAADNLQTAYNNQAQGKAGIAKLVGTPAEQQKLQYEADQAKYQAQKVELDTKEFGETSPERVAGIRAQSQSAQANAALAKANADLAVAKEPFEIQQAQTAVQQAKITADRARAQLTTEQAQAVVAPRVAEAGAVKATGEAAITTATAAQAPRTAAAAATGAEADAALKQYQLAVAKATTPDEINTAHEKYLQATSATRTAAAGATVAEAGAAVAPETAQANLRLAQANATRAELDVRQTQANLDATTDEDRRRAIQLDLGAKQATLDTANQQLDLARRTADSAVAQAAANVQATQATTQGTLEGIQKGQLGTLYGAQQRAREIGNLISSGQISPEEGTALLHDHLTTAIQGTTPFELGKTLADIDTSRRTQDVGLAQSKMSDYTSATTSLYNTFSGLNAAVAPGSDVAGRGLLGALNLVGDRLSQYGNVPDRPLPAMLQPRVAGPPAGAAAGPPVPVSAPSPAGAPAGAGGGGHQITINIGGAGGDAGSSGLLPPGDAGTVRDPRLAGLPNQVTPVPAMLQQDQPATPDHVTGNLGWDPALVQEALNRMNTVSGSNLAGGNPSADWAAG